MLIEEVVSPFIHVACQYNIHSFGLFVVGVSSCCRVLKKIVSFARRIINIIFFGLIAMGTFFFVTAVKKILRYLHRHGQMLSQLLRPKQRADDTHPPVPRLSVSWGDGLPSDHLSFQPHTDGESVSRNWYLLVKSQRNKQRLTKHIGRMKLVLSEISSLVKQVSFVDIDPTRRQAFLELLSRVDDNYWLEDRAQSALAELTLLHNELKGQYPRRFRPYSNYEQLFEECVLFEQGIDMIMLEIKLRAEFNRNKALDVVRNTIEEAEMEDDEAEDPIADRAEANAPAALEVPPQQAAILPVVDNDEFQVDFDNPDDGGDEEVEEDVPAVRRRSKVSLHSDLGSYWSAPLGKRTGTTRRTSSRVRRKPERFEP
jgi:hypothetical protein